MQAAAATKTSEARSTRGFFRSSPSTAFDQYLHDIQKLPLITDAAEERRLARLAQTGDESAAERLVTANLRFVISYVKKYQGHGLDLSELVAIGNEGLLKAVRKFDPDQGVKFISYAVWWVRQAVLKALAEQTRSVRIPLNQNSQLIRMARAEMVLSQVLNREATDVEVARVLAEPIEQVRNARQISCTEVSLDAPIDRQDRGIWSGRTHRWGSGQETRPARGSRRIFPQVRQDFRDRLCRIGGPVRQILPSPLI